MKYVYCYDFYNLALYVYAEGDEHYKDFCGFDFRDHKGNKYNEVTITEKLEKARAFIEQNVKPYIIKVGR